MVHHTQDDEFDDFTRLVCTFCFGFAPHKQTIVKCPTHMSAPCTLHDNDVVMKRARARVRLLFKCVVTQRPTRKRPIAHYEMILVGGVRVAHDSRETRFVCYLPSVLLFLFLKACDHFSCKMI